jgi:hypothetical protein
MAETELWSTTRLGGMAMEYMETADIDIGIGIGIGVGTASLAASTSSILAEGTTQAEVVPGCRAIW